ncbi:transcription termination factor Rho [Dehalococcoidia bacterium]|nr:transcription termination factor Rho [Dehalococcoidia bacterium]MCL0050589.1 transcription termination factor Rho [Dehalococcoidia bacterium]MCL0065030.1 transcription termination factor Rho [Dehalococcoidia bacterium]
MNYAELQSKTREELLALARESGISGCTGLKKDEMVLRLLQGYAEQQGHTFRGGTLEITSDGHGFLRQNGLCSRGEDIYISQSQIRRFLLRNGDLVTGQVRPPKNGERYSGLLRVEAINGLDPEAAKSRPYFDYLTPVFPQELINLETDPKNLSTRLINLISPIGRGQRGLIVSPPKAGKTFLLKHIANGALANYNDIYVMVCLIGERPEEVTDWRKSINAEVVSSTFDEPVEEHTRVAEVAMERAKRLVELGQDVLILLDSLTRLTRAYNLEMPSSGRTLSGGVDTAALYPPKRFFGAARNTEEKGSLTIIATCLIDTGSRMDEVIYEEFKGTGNMELHLDRKLAERRTFPAIDIQRSGTRHEELLLDENTLKQVWLLRRMMAMVSSSSADSTEATERILDRLARSKSNAEFLASLSKGM